MVETQSASQRSAAELERGKGAAFYRNPRRVAMLMLLAPFFYWIWWIWQVSNFTRRERFPRARRFWWFLIPIYGPYLLYQQFADISASAKQASGHGFNAALTGWLAFIGLYSGGGSSRAPAWVDLASILIGGLALSVVGFLVQRGANAYIAATYPGETARSVTIGEIIAAILGILLLGLFILTALLPAST